jgi:PHP family Zn ribbon phosphoesterase
MLRTFRADLHVHTCLSPCAELEMSPRAIVRQARERDIDILGICDHNSAENVPALRDAGQPLRVSVLAGMEITSQEEVHILGLFDEIESALELQAVVYAHLEGENDPEAFGLQVVVNRDGEVLRFNPRLLIGASSLPLDRVVSLVHEFDGVAIASHVDREGFSLIGQLGFVPDNLPIDALEFSPAISRQTALERFGSRRPLVSASDAHRLDEVGRSSTSFLMEDGTVREIRKALSEDEGRRILN